MLVQPEKLPDSLQEIYCNNNQITKLRPWALDQSSPKGMLVLPEKLPDSLQKIYCKNNRITKLSEKLDSLQIIYFSNNQIIKLPEKLPDSLQLFFCSNNEIVKLNFNDGKIPKSLRYINCRGNVIEEISLVVLKLLYFDCDNKENVILKSAQKLLKKGMKRTMFKKYIFQWIVCKQLINNNFNDCSYIITQYI